MRVTNPAVIQGSKPSLLGVCILLLIYLSTFTKVFLLCFLFHFIIFIHLYTIKKLFFFSEEDAALTGNLSSLLSFLSPEHDNFLHELNGFWSYNDTIDLSKYEDFDHSKFLGKLNLIF